MTHLELAGRYLAVYLAGMAGVVALTYAGRAVNLPVAWAAMALVLPILAAMTVAAQAVLRAGSDPFGARIWAVAAMLALVTGAAALALLLAFRAAGREVSLDAFEGLGGPGAVWVGLSALTFGFVRLGLGIGLRKGLRLLGR